MLEVNPEKYWVHKKRVMRINFTSLIEYRIKYRLQVHKRSTESNSLSPQSGQMNKPVTSLSADSCSSGIFSTKKGATPEII